VTQEPPRFIQTLKAIWQALCPRCRKGVIFDKGIDVFKRCPECDLLLNRESGYFLGALYIEYGLAGAIMGILAFAIMKIWFLSTVKTVLIAAILFLPLIIPTIRLSRVLWVYWDYLVDPPA
jgi:uncharacterized protein (DUF983 family)